MLGVALKGGWQECSGLDRIAELKTLCKIRQCHLSERCPQATALKSPDVGPRYQIVDLAVGPAVDDPGEDVGEVTVRLDSAVMDFRPGKLAVLKTLGIKADAGPSQKISLIRSAKLVSLYIPLSESVR